MHQNLMTCVIVGRENPVLVCNGTDQTLARAICIKPGVSHRVVIGAAGAEIVYLDGIKLDPKSPDFRELPTQWHTLPNALKVEDRQELRMFRKRLNADPSPVDPSVMRIVERLYSDPFERLSQMDLAQELQLERTLAMRHFKEATGQTFRKFKIWAAMISAVQAAHSGERIGLAGIQAGFSDAAHLTRTAAVLFGITPTQGLSGLMDFKSVAAE